MELIKTTQSEAQAIADNIHYQNMVKEYHKHVTNGPYTAAEVKELFGASKQFLNCTQEEAIAQYFIVGTHKGALTIEKGGTRAYAVLRETINGDWTIPHPGDGYDLSGFTFEVIEYSADLFLVPDDI